MNDTMTSGEADRVEAVEPYSPAWWQNRSTEELRALLDRGFGSAAFEGATAETERRAREDLRAQDDAAETMAEQKKSLRLKILEALLLGCLIAIIAVLLLR